MEKKNPLNQERPAFCNEQNIFDLADGIGIGILIGKISWKNQQSRKKKYFEELRNGIN